MPMLTAEIMDAFRPFLEQALENEPVTQIESMLSAFHARFPVERFKNLDGEELLMDMHGRQSRDCLMYWLEFKDDDQFRSRAFGSIAGGSAYKFGVFQSAETSEWITGSPSHREVIDVEKAGEIAQEQRDEFLAALDVVQRLPSDPEHEAWVNLHDDVKEAAPKYYHLAFFHKWLYLCAPDKLDDYHNTTHQKHRLIQVGISPFKDSVYENARLYVQLLDELRVDTGRKITVHHVTSALNMMTGPPVLHWRIGTGWPPKSDMWPSMRDGNHVSIGWGELGDLTEVVGGATGKAAVEAIKAAVARVWPEWSPQMVGQSAHQIWRFFMKMEEGHRVYAAKGMDIRGVGEVVGPYVYRPDAQRYKHHRAVRWLTTDEFRTTSKAGLRTTVYHLTQDRAVDLLCESARRLYSPEAKDESIQSVSGLAPAVREIHEQLERKGQVILYGPPGTGKTWRALQAAEELVSRKIHRVPWGQLSQQQRTAFKEPGKKQRIWTCTFHPAYGYEDFVEGLKPVPVAGGLDFRPMPGLFRRICNEARKHPDEPFVLVIDEFNRGDAPRIFGELLTLLELDKREGTPVVLPYSSSSFTIPRGVSVLATMNTADRSIALLDAALRRRFGFIEYMPDPTPLKGAVVEGIPLDQLLIVLNRRLVDTLGDRARNLQVGHAYFMKQAKPFQSVLNLRNAIRYDVLPLLQEYCSDDPDSLVRVVGKAFYDRTKGAFRAEPFARGAEEQFLAGLNAWDPETLRADVSTLVDDDEVDEVDEIEESDLESIGA